MIGEKPTSLRGSRGKEYQTYVDGNREAYFYIKDTSGEVTWYTEAALALSAWERAGGDAALYCGRKPNNMQRVR